MLDTSRLDWVKCTVAIQYNAPELLFRPSKLQVHAFAEVFGIAH